MWTTRNWIVTSAWPYVNGVPHLGTLVGSVLSADVFARYLRMRGHRVVFVSGSDEHGTVIEIEARRRGLEPKAFTDQAHEYIKRIWRLWNISFDNYTRTESEVHKDFVRGFLLDVERN
ncbi:MAG: class I tRNA ligase family protein, partial [Sulfolobales archaeon]